MDEPSSFGAHPSTDVLEEYAFNRLSEARTASLEEHVLLCTHCQAELRRVDEYIQLMKQATAIELATPAVAKRAWISVDWSTVQWGKVSGTFAALATVVLGIGLSLGLHRHGPAEAAEQVELVAFRGPEMAHVGGGRPIDIIIDVTDLPDSSEYLVEVVTTAGQIVSKGKANLAAGKLSARISNGLKGGLYWVRLYSATGEQLREYGLRAG